jgi:peptide/nickel transport system permease protein
VSRRKDAPEAKTPMEKAVAAESAKSFELPDSPRTAVATEAPDFELTDEVVATSGELDVGDGPLTIVSGTRLRTAHDLSAADAAAADAILHPEGVVRGAGEAHPTEVVVKGRVPRWRLMLEVFLQNKLAVASVVVLALIVIMVFLGPLVYRTNQTDTNAIILNGTKNLPPSLSHPLGTDSTGWDELGRIMYGGRYSLTLGMLAGLITIIVGTAYGMVSGYYGGVLDTAMMRVIDAALSIPYLFLLVALVTIFGPTNTLLLLVIGLTGWWGNSRIIRGDAMAIRDLEYTVASRSMGARSRHIIRRHVYPNSISNIVTVGTFSVADAILALSALGFIGLGVQSPGTDWGSMMYVGTTNLINGFWWQIYPVAIIFVLVLLCINYIGDALRDVFEVRLRSR